MLHFYAHIVKHEFEVSNSTGYELVFTVGKEGRYFTEEERFNQAESAAPNQWLLAVLCVYCMESYLSRS